MARIRTVKPSFLRHEKLQDLEAEHPGKYVMMVFMGLWMLADSKGRFDYKPRTMKLDILPFLDYSMQHTLDLLENNDFIRVYEISGQKYGCIPTFSVHQRITGKELTEGERFPAEIALELDHLQGNTWEISGIQPDVQEGKVKEESREEEGITEIFSPGEPDMDLLKDVLGFFNFNEITNPDKQREVGRLLNCLVTNNREKYFKEQFASYSKYKTINDSFKHSFRKFLGTPALRFEDGAWNAENWTSKLTAEKSKASQNNKPVINPQKGVEAALDMYNQLKR